MSESSCEPLQYPAIVQHPPVGIRCRKIKLIEGNAKCRHLKKIICEGTLRQVQGYHLVLQI
jgi:hypothetical protein